MKRGSSPSGDAAAGAGSAGAGAARTEAARILGRGRPLQRLHWLASGGLCLLSDIKAETLTREPYYRHFWQDASTGAGTAESVAEDQPFLPKFPRSGLRKQAMDLRGLPC